MGTVAARPPPTAIGVARLRVTGGKIRSTGRGRAVDQHEAGEELEHLRELEAWRSAFLAAAAHDLRSPLSGIRAHAETLIERADDLSDDQRTSFLHRIVHTADRLSALLDDLLDLDRATRGAVELQRVPTAVGPFVREVVADHPTDDRAVEVSADDDLPEVLVDRRRFGQVVGQLLDNALAHTPPEATITVVVVGHDVRVRVVVEDDGPGVPETVRDRLFVPFVSAAPDGTGDHHSGIGLSLVDLLVRLHGGTVHHEDRPGGGARFVVDLPPRP